MLIQDCWLDRALFCTLFVIQNCCNIKVLSRETAYDQIMIVHGTFACKFICKLNDVDDFLKKIVESPCPTIVEFSQTNFGRPLSSD